MERTPPAGSKPDTSSCIQCQRPDDMKMVQCDKCLNWVHYDCAGVDESIEHKPFKCEMCSRIESRAKKAVSRQSKTSSRASKVSSRAEEYANLELQRLEDELLLKKKSAEDELRLKKKSAEDELRLKTEELQFKKKLEEEFLERKYEVLRAKISEGSSASCSSRSKRSVQMWVDRSTIMHEIGPNGRIQATPRREEAIDTLHHAPPVTNYTDVMLPHSTLHQRQYPFTSAHEMPPTRYPERQQTQPNDSFKSAHQVPQYQPVSDDCGMRHLLTRSLFSKELLNFSGKTEEWPMFISAYERTTRMCAITEDENVMRLQRALKGRALEAVQNRLLLPSSASDAIETLRQLFGNPEAIIYGIVNKIRSEPSPKADRFDTIIAFATSVQNLHATMKACILAADLANPMLVHELVERLPPSLKLEWGRHLTSNPNQACEDLTSYSEWLSELARAANRVSRVALISAPIATNAPCRNARILTHSIQKTECGACDEVGHTLTDCKTFKTLSVEARWRLIRARDICGKCLLSGHNYRRCNKTTKCRVNNCPRTHHPMLHNPNSHSKESSETTHPERQNIHITNKTVLFRIVPVTLHSHVASIKTFAFLDDGSSVTLLEDSLAQELQLEGSNERLCLKWTGDTARVEPDSKRVSLHISSQNSAMKRHHLSNVRTVSSLKLPEQTIRKLDLDCYAHLRQLPIQECTNAMPRIIIGLDNWHVGLPLRAREGLPSQPIATKTRLGWVVQGSCNLSAEEKTGSYHICECDHDDRIDKEVKLFFSLENLGVQLSETNTETKEEQRARQLLEERTTLRDGRYTSALLWRYDEVNLPDSFPMALRRLECLERKMKKEPQLADKMRKQIQHYLKMGYCRIATEYELSCNESKRWYLPLFTVSNSNKPNKFRMVWDAAARVNGISLNSMLLKGPDELTLLPGVLQRFRERPIAICGDIREMFHQIRIRKEDQHYQRFLWRDGKQHQKPDVYLMQVMTFGATCSPSIAQYVKNHNAKRFREQYPRAATSIMENHYVDDMLDCTDTVEDAVTLANEVKFIHSQAGFEITKWLSNSKEVMTTLHNSQMSSLMSLNIAEPEMTKVLGMYWNTHTDSFTFSISNCNAMEKVQKGRFSPH